MAGEEEEDLPCSQFSLGLSQGTLNNLLEAAENSSNIVEEFFFTDDENPTIMDGPSTITIQRSLITPQPNMNISSSQQFGPPTCTSVGYPPPLHHSEINSGVSSTNTTPTRATPPNVSPGMSECSSSGSYRSHMSSLPFMQKKVPSNMPFPGDYGFNLVLPDDDDKPSKTTPFTYSNLTKRAYIRRDTTIALTFSFTKVPPHSVIRAMAIHKTAELLGEVLQCCPKHIEEQRKKGHQHPRHFICGASKSEAMYCEDPISGRLSITIPISSLQQKSENSVQSFFVFPCFTSEIHKGPGQLAQLIFTLEIEGHVVGRAVVDVRVCASTGRDRDNDENKLGSSTCTTPSEGDNTVRQARKRPASVTQNLECTLPSKITRPSLLTKQLYTAETYPELFPFIDVCIKMIEKVYSCNFQMDSKTASDGGCTSFERTEATNTPIVQQVPNINSIDSWLQFLSLTQYGPTLERHGVCSLSQAINLNDDQLIGLGIKDRLHRQTLLDGIKYIPTAADDLEESPLQPLSQSTQPYHPQLLSQLSSVSSASTSSTSQTLDVLRIQMKKTFSTSSSSSNGET